MTALTCPVCGAPVPPSKHRPREYCSPKCATEAKRMRYRDRNCCKSRTDHSVLGRMRKEREERQFMVRARLAKRDLDYAESPCAAKVTVDCVRTTDGRTLVVETRGQRCVAPRITHLGIN